MSTLEQKTTALQIEFPFPKKKISAKKEFATAKPSRVIEMALADLKAVEKLDAYRIDMGCWHQPMIVFDMFDSTDEQKCSVCLAGTVIANRLGGNPKDSLAPFSFSSAIANRLLALDEFRSGRVNCGLNEMGYSQEVMLPFVNIPEYKKKNRASFHKAMQALADMLKTKGL